MGETQTILKKFETNARKRLEETKELLKGFLNREVETEKSEKDSDESKLDYP